MKSELSLVDVNKVQSPFLWIPSLLTLKVIKSVVIILKQFDVYVNFFIFMYTVY